MENCAFSYNTLLVKTQAYTHRKESASTILGRSLREKKDDEVCVAVLDASCSELKFGAYCFYRLLFASEPLDLDPRWPIDPVHKL
jgi:hypothetical protein